MVELAAVVHLAKSFVAGVLHLVLGLPNSAELVLGQNEKVGKFDDVFFGEFVHLLLHHFAALVFFKLRP